MSICKATGFSLSYAYKKGCRCSDCRARKAIYTAKEAPKARKRVRLWQQKHPQRMRLYRKKSLNLTWLRNYGALWKQQKGRCVICRQSEKKNGRKLALDHNHRTGKARGLLCVSCNLGLGHFQDNHRLLQKASIYLKRRA